MLTFDPTSAFNSVDLPALGAPMRAMNPQRVGSSTIKLVRRHTDAGKHLSGSGLFGGTFRAADAFRRRPVRQHDGDAKFRIVMGSRSRELAIVRGWKATRLRPFLQDRFWIAQRPQRLEHPLFPETGDQFIGRAVAAIDEHRADKRLAHVRQYRGSTPAARMRLGTAELEHGPEVHGTRNLGAGLLANQIGQASRQLPFVRLREGAIEHVGYHQAKNVIAEEFQSLIAGSAIAAG